MKKVKFLIVIGCIFATSINLFALADKLVSFSAKDTLTQQQLLAEFSLFYEFQKQGDYKSAYPHGWNVINNNPKNFLQYKPFKKMEVCLWYMYDSVATIEEEKKLIADTALTFYDLAIKYKEEEETSGYFIARKAYIMETWLKMDFKEVIATYELALQTNPNFNSFYKDRLGLLYIANAESDPDYQIRAINLYSDLSTQEPEEPLWPQRLANVATDIEQLVSIFKQVWDMDRDNNKKAWDYASMCMRAEQYQNAVEPLEFLVGKSPESINYWRQLASAYDKVEKYDKAANAYLKLIELEPTNRDHYVNAAIEYKNLGQLSTARQYLYKASDISPDWDYPIYIEAMLYETAASRRCGTDFENKLVYQLARDVYRKCANMGGQYSGHASQRANQLGGAIPSKEEYFFRNIKPGTSVSVSNACYGWIGKSVTSY